MSLVRAVVILAFSVMLLLAAGTSVAYSSSIIVDPSGGSGVEHSISAAIARASAGDTIIVHSGTYYEEVYVDKGLLWPGWTRAADDLS